jgi:recombination protein RecA
VELGLIEKRGSFYTYREERIGQGRENAKEYLRQNAEVAAAVEAQVREAGFAADRAVSLPEFAPAAEVEV